MTEGPVRPIHCHPWLDAKSGCRIYEKPDQTELRIWQGSGHFISFFFFNLLGLWCWVLITLFSSQDIILLTGPYKAALLSIHTFISSYAHFSLLFFPQATAIFLYWPCCVACRIPTKDQTMPSTVEEQSLNYWTPRKAPCNHFNIFNSIFGLYVFKGVCVVWFACILIYIIDFVI